MMKIQILNVEATASTFSIFSKRQIFSNETFASFFLISCERVSPICPIVDLKLTSVDSRTADFTWNDIGSDYYYSATCYQEEKKLWFSGKDTTITTERRVVAEISETKETKFSIIELLPNTGYIFSVVTHSVSQSAMSDGTKPFYFQTKKNSLLRSGVCCSVFLKKFF